MLHCLVSQERFHWWLIKELALLLTWFKPDWGLLLSMSFSALQYISMKVSAKIVYRKIKKITDSFMKVIEGEYTDIIEHPIF